MSVAPAPSPTAHEPLLEAMQALSHAHALEEIATVVKEAARELAHADGVTFVLRDEDRCWYFDESAIAPLWKGRRFPMNSCVSGWAMLNKRSLTIDDVLADPRVPHDLYRPTFVRSLAMVPIRRADPIGAIGVYWSSSRRPDERELLLLESLAASTATAITNAELERKLREAIALREEFIAVAAHELRTPLTPLAIQLQALARAFDGGSEPRERLRARVADVGQCMQRVERLVATMLDQVELWSDRITLERAEVDLVALARRAVATVAERAKLSETPIDLVAPAPVWVAADSARVEQAVGQLLDNALKFGAGRPVDVRVEADEREAHVVVCDHGVGLSDEAQARLFDRFARGVSTTHFGGFGLGLWLAQQIATAHGGRIAVESTSGAGATFTLSLPRAR